MTDVMQLANIAENILRTDTELNGFELISENIITKWRNSPSTDSEGRELCYLQLHALDELHRLLRTTVDNGKIKAHEETLND